VDGNIEGLPSGGPLSFPVRALRSVRVIAKQAFEPPGSGPGLAGRVRMRAGRSVRRIGGVTVKAPVNQTERLRQNEQREQQHDATSSGAGCRAD